MVIGLDLDGCIFDFVGAESRLFASIPPNPDKADIESYLKTSVEQNAFWQLLKDPKFMGGLSMFPGVRENLIPYLNKHDVIVVTGREPEVRAVTIKRLDEEGLNVKEYRWAHGKTKDKFIDGLECLIEDLPFNIVKIPKDFPVIMPARSYNITFINKQKDQRRLFNYLSIEQLINILEMLQGGLNVGRS